MGYGMYSHAAHLALTEKRETKATEVFTQRRCHPLMDPHGVVVRESRDSDEHPESLAVMFALDVSGSMGDIPKRMATTTLPRFMQALQRARVESPQLCFVAVGNAISDAAPLQVGQFESTEGLIDQWLTAMYLEGGGAGGNESYELAMLFAARHTRLDCVEKRGRRGYLFLTGDEPPNLAVSREQVKRVIGVDLAHDLPIRDLIVDLLRTWEPFFLVPGADRARDIERPWRDLLGDRVVVMGDDDDTCAVAAGLVSLLEGAVDGLDGLVGLMTADGFSREAAARVARALAPFAASICKDGAPVSMRRAALPKGDRPSGLVR